MPAYFPYDRGLFWEVFTLLYYLQFSHSGNINHGTVRTSQESGMFRFMRTTGPGPGYGRRTSSMCTVVPSPHPCPTVKRVDTVQHSSPRYQHWAGAGSTLRLVVHSRENREHSSPRYAQGAGGSSTHCYHLGAGGVVHTVTHPGAGDIPTVVHPGAGETYPSLYT